MSSNLCDVLRRFCAKTMRPGQCRNPRADPARRHPSIATDHLFARVHGHPRASPTRITSPRVRSHLHRHVSRHSLHARLFLFRALEGHLEAHILLFTRGGHDEDAAARGGRGGDARDVGVERARARDVGAGGEHDDEARGVDDVTTSDGGGRGGPPLDGRSCGGVMGSELVCVWNECPRCVCGGRVTSRLGSIGSIGIDCHVDARDGDRRRQHDDDDDDDE